MPFLSVNFNVDPNLLDVILQRAGDCFNWADNIITKENGVCIIVGSNKYLVSPHNILDAISKILNNSSIRDEYHDSVTQILFALRATTPADMRRALYNEDVDLIFQVAIFGYVHYPINY